MNRIFYSRLSLTDPSISLSDPEETQRRRELLWELFVYDSWQALTFGRPPAFTIAQVDCKAPHPHPPVELACSSRISFFLLSIEYHNLMGTLFFVVSAWKQRFCAIGMTVIHDQVFGAKTPSYAIVLQCDRKLRACPVPPALQIVGSNGSSEKYGDTQSTSLIMQQHTVLAMREMSAYIICVLGYRLVSDCSCGNYRSIVHAP